MMKANGALRVIRTATLAAVMLVAIALVPQRAEATSWYSNARKQCAGSSRVMLCYHNQTRQMAGLSPLRPRWRLHASARTKRLRILQCGHVTHEPCGDSWVRPFYQVHYLPTACRWLVGENLAWGWTSPWAAFNALMQSSAHRANILNPLFWDFGASRSASPWGELWVVHYGRRC
jgi:uncharacterized protein YkwD